jgi:hypothetical protein
VFSLAVLTPHDDNDSSHDHYTARLARKSRIAFPGIDLVRGERMARALTRPVYHGQWPHPDGVWTGGLSVYRHGRGFAGAADIPARLLALDVAPGLKPISRHPDGLQEN